MSGCGHRFSWEKTFADSPKTMKFAKVFSLESLPLYGTISSVVIFSQVILSSMIVHFYPPVAMMAP